MKKIIILTDNFFTKRDFDKHGIKKASKSFNTTVIDLTYLMNQKYYAEYYNKNSFYNNNCFKLLKIKTNNGLKSFLSTLDDKNNKYYILDFLSSNRQVVNYLRNTITSKKNTKLIKISKGRIPEAGLFEKLFFLKIETNLISKIIKYFLRKIYTVNDHKYKNHNYDLHIITSLMDEIGLNKNDKVNHVYAHAYDYDFFLKSNNSTEQKIRKKNYAVYLDEIMVDHPDFKKLKIKNPVSKKIYNEELSLFFKNFTEATGIEIIIAQHPRKFYLEKNINLNMLNQTPYLVKHSKFVILHCSTSVSYGVLNKKPLIYLDSNNYSWLRPKIAAFYNQTGGVIINISKKFKKNLLKIDSNTINNKRYNDYITNYIKHPKSQHSVIENLIQYCKKN